MEAPLNSIHFSLLGAGLILSLLACSQTASPEELTVSVRQAAQQAVGASGKVLDARVPLTTLGTPRWC